MRKFVLVTVTRLNCDPTSCFFRGRIFLLAFLFMRKINSEAGQAQGPYCERDENFHIFRNFFLGAFSRLSRQEPRTMIKPL